MLQTNYIPELWKDKVAKTLEDYNNNMVFYPKFKRFPKLCRKLKLGKWRYEPKWLRELGGGEIKIRRVQFDSLNVCKPNTTDTQGGTK